MAMEQDSAPSAPAPWVPPTREYRAQWTFTIAAAFLAFAYVLILTQAGSIAGGANGVFIAGALGIDNAKQVVAYDASGGAFAARLWWMLRWIGHSSVAVLDGGWQAWLAGAHPVSAERSVAQPATYTARSRAQLAVDASYVSAHLNDPAFALIDARAPDRFRGENETLDPVGTADANLKSDPSAKG